jgi:hypothetical protein
MILTEAGVHPNVSALVYVAAPAPGAGEDYTALAKTFPTPPASAGIVFDGDEGRLSEAAFLHSFAGDVPEAKAKVLNVAGQPAELPSRLSAAAVDGIVGQARDPCPKWGTGPLFSARGRASPVWRISVA